MKKAQFLHFVLSQISIIKKLKSGSTTLARTLKPILFDSAIFNSFIIILFFKDAQKGYYRSNITFFQIASFQPYPSAIHNTPITTIPSDQIRRISSAIRPTIGQPADPNLRPTITPINSQSPQHQLAGIPRSVSPHIKSEMEKQTILKRTLAKLNDCVPFRVRFKKEPTVRGRVYGFDYAHTRPNPELKVFIEYPIGNNIIQK